MFSFKKATLITMIGFLAAGAMLLCVQPVKAKEAKLYFYSESADAIEMITFEDKKMGILFLKHCLNNSYLSECEGSKCNNGDIKAPYEMGAEYDKMGLLQKFKQNTRFDPGITLLNADASTAKVELIATGDAEAQTSSSYSSGNGNDSSDGGGGIQRIGDVVALGIVGLFLWWLCKLISSGAYVIKQDIITPITRIFRGRP